MEASGSSWGLGRPTGTPAVETVRCQPLIRPACGFLAIHEVVPQDGTAEPEAPTSLGRELPGLRGVAAHLDGKRGTGRGGRGLRRRGRTGRGKAGSIQNSAHQKMLRNSMSDPEIQSLDRNAAATLTWR